MKRVHVLVEGQTEEAFVNQVLVPRVGLLQIHLTTILVTTRVSKYGANFKGGIRSYLPIKKELKELLRDSSASAVTTIMDYYGLPQDFPGNDLIVKSLDPYARVRHLEQSLFADLGSPKRLLPYFSLHEFEALLLSSPQLLNEEFSKRKGGTGFESLLADGRGPEEINDGAETHPAARIKALAPSYDKVFHGPLLAARIGLPTLREKCPHFHRWVTALENLGTAPGQE